MGCTNCCTSVPHKMGDLFVTHAEIIQLTAPIEEVFQLSPTINQLISVFPVSYTRGVHDVTRIKSRIKQDNVTFEFAGFVKETVPHGQAFVWQEQEGELWEVTFTEGDIIQSEHVRKYSNNGTLFEGTVTENSASGRLRQLKDGVVHEILPGPHEIIVPCLKH